MPAAVGLFMIASTAGLLAIFFAPQAVIEVVTSSVTTAILFVSDLFHILVVQWHQQPGLMSVATAFLILGITAGLIARSLRHRA